jgi:hypothetical protein
MIDFRVTKNIFTSEENEQEEKNERKDQTMLSFFLLRVLIVKQRRQA